MYDAANLHLFFDFRIKFFITLSQHSPKHFERGDNIVSVIDECIGKCKEQILFRQKAINDDIGIEYNKCEDKPIRELLLQQKNWGMGWSQLAYSVISNRCGGNR